METIDQPRNWLASLSTRLQFAPKVIGSDYQPLALEWITKKCEDPLGGRDANQYVSFPRNGEKCMIVMGGWCPRRDSRRNDIYESAGLVRSLKLVTDSAEWSRRCDFSAISSQDGKHIYVIGGDDGSIKADVWLSRDYARTFQLQVLEAPWKGRVEFCTTLSQAGEILICGGRIPVRSGPGTYLNDIWLSTDKGVTWNCICDSAPWKKRAGAGLICLDDRIILLGGTNETFALDDVWSSSDSGRTWTRVNSQPTPWRGRRNLKLVSDTVSNELLMLGGTDADGIQLTDSWASVDFGKTWMPRKHLPSAVSQAPAVATDGGKLVIVGSNTRAESVSDLRYIMRDCLFLLSLGRRLEDEIPRHTWISTIIPFTVDTRLLWDRRDVPWKKVTATPP